MEIANRDWKWISKKIFRRPLWLCKKSGKDFVLVTDDEEFSNFFLQDLKNLGASAENVLKKVQDMIDDKSVPNHYIKPDEKDNT